MSIASRIVRTAYKSVGDYWIVDGKMWSIEASSLTHVKSKGSTIMLNSASNIVVNIPGVGDVNLKFSHRNDSGDEIVAWVYEPVDSKLKSVVHGVIVLND